MARINPNQADQMSVQTRSAQHSQPPPPKRSSSPPPPADTGDSVNISRQARELANQVKTKAVEKPTTAIKPHLEQQAAELTKASGMLKFAKPQGMRFVLATGTFIPPGQTTSVNLNA